MAADYKIVEEAKKPLGMNPKKFAMWLFIAGITMLFASLTSAYIVRQAEGNWVYFELPGLLYWSTGIILASSMFMQLAYRAAKKDQPERVKSMVSITAILGLTFLVTQYFAWGNLVENSIYLVGNPSGSFLYILTGLHGLHLVSAIIYLMILWVAAYRFKVHSKNLSQIEMCATYWHFLGGLWLYLFIFLLLLR